ncbi:Acyltransferase [Faecalibacterium duncaniae]|uniref:1-acyl-sn-glycerol-3-phosphate acyltransferase n=2 Tax=Faecalibacterium TaxID=216851 RepID=C7H185_FAED2|nr:Acyltransferase [Faecalibacterium duncaniae]
MPLCYLSAYKYTRILWILQAKKHAFVKKVCSLPFCPKVCYNDTGLLGRKEERNLSILRTIALFVYLFGYMIVHYATLRRAERALAAGDLDTVEQIVKANIPRWSRGILHVTGARMTVEGQKNIPAGPCVFVGNHRSYYDIPILLTALDAPHGILAKEELEKIPLLNRWMKLLGCVFVKRDDIRASVKALNDATAIVESGRSFVIFPEGTRYKGEEGGAGEFKAGAFRIAIKTGVPVVPVAISGARGLFEGHGLRATPGDIRVRILPAIQTAGMSKAEQKQLPDAVRQTILAQL